MPAVKRKRARKEKRRPSVWQRRGDGRKRRRREKLRRRDFRRREKRRRDFRNRLKNTEFIY